MLHISPLNLKLSLLASSQTNPFKSSKSLKKALLFAVLLCGLASAVKAQPLYPVTHRPKLDWYEINTPHFRVIYHEGYEETARRAARLLELEYESIRSLTGGKLARFPVVINGYNDLSNGYVTPFLFRIEVEAPPITGKVLNPRTGGHLENLMPHELVHALQISETGGAGVTGFLHIFGPDLGRSMHMLSPLGLLEGFAVYHESHMEKESSGRGHFAPFTQQFNENAAQDSPWNMGQLVTPSEATVPYDRHYIGGYHFSEWLIESYGKDAVQRSIKSFARFPFIGFGVHLWIQTGTWPRTMYRNFAAEVQSGEAVRKLEVGYVSYTPIELPQLTGEQVYNPIWLNNQEVLFFANAYNARRGFFIYNVEAGSLRQLAQTGTDLSYSFSLSPDSAYVMYSRYVIHPHIDDMYTADLHRIALEDGEISGVSAGKRLASPNFSPFGYYNALQNDRETMQWVKVYSDSVARFVNIWPDNLVQVAANPVQGGLSAVIANRNGVQAIWFTFRDHEQTILRMNPDIVFPDGSLFDVTWSSDGLRLLFSGEIDGVMQVFEYDYVEDRLFQLTNAAFNAMEASYAPGNDAIAMVVLEGGLLRLSVLGRESFYMQEIPSNYWRVSVEEKMNGPRLGDELLGISQSWEAKPYETGASWLKPRIVLPISSRLGSDDSQTLGLSMHSGDILRQHSYSLALEYGRGKVFHDLSYQYSGLFPTLDLRTSHTPFNPGNPFGSGVVRFGQQTEHSVGGIFHWRNDHPSAISQIAVVPRIRVMSTSIDYEFGQDQSFRDDLGRTTRASLNMIYYFRPQQQIRSADLNSGFRLYGQVDQDLHNTLDWRLAFRGARVGFEAYRNPFRIRNHTFSLGADFVYQSYRNYNLPGILHQGFDQSLFYGDQPILKTFMLVSSRYTFPLKFTDDGYFTLPVYLHRFYGVLFQQTFVNTGAMTRNNIDPVSRTLVGAGLRYRISIFHNAVIDLGIGYATILNLPDSGVIVNEF